ncbi:hypothetical protein NLB33_04170 [Mycolicibacterium smegmatis]|uniref:hypothetical protein n=1 Tax=Mycolicibacterium smegmatis TaxID=1772 RepID=UPI0020A32EDB|nr:hypothetical protein [Mycolicibacterium smegmatis]MCP2622048.1 hypothetical protein [Mycolicibacterium smegmatis]
MANELNVSSDGLRIAAAASETATAALAGDSGTSTNVGIAAMDAALASLRRRQADRISGQAGDMSTGSTRYDTTDSGGADAITTVSV